MSANRCLASAGTDGAPARFLSVLCACLFLGACSGEHVTDPSLVGAMSLSVVSGDQQSGRAGQELPAPVVVQVVRDGAPVQGQIVNFRVTAGGGSTFAGVAITSVQGIAQELWTLGPVPGAQQRLEARAVDAESGGRLLFGTFSAIALSNAPPTARIDRPAADTTISAGASVVFQGTGTDTDGTIASHAWTFGDGGGSALEDPGAHTYAAAGTYTVTYTVTDNEGATSVAATRRVTVVAATGSNYALRFYGNGVNDIDRVKILVDDPTNSLPGPPVDVGATDFTIEFWVRGRAADNTGSLSAGQCNNAFGGWIHGNIILDRDRNNQDRNYGVSFTDGRVAFGVGGNGTGFRTICGTSLVLDDAWHHVALTRVRSTGVMTIYVDGVRQQSQTGPGGDISYPDAANQPYGNDRYLVIGAEKLDANRNAYPSFNGYIDELRFSTTLRYTGASFVRPSGRFVPDAATAALYHFDEGQGNVIGDSSGAAGGPSNGVRNLGGSPAGPQWVTSTAPTGG